MRKVLFEEAAELGVKAFAADAWLLSPAPNIDPEGPGVEGWAMIVCSSGGHSRRGTGLERNLKSVLDGPRTTIQW